LRILCGFLSLLLYNDLLINDSIIIHITTLSLSKPPVNLQSASYFNEFETDTEQFGTVLSQAFQIAVGNGMILKLREIKY